MSRSLRARSCKSLTGNPKKPKNQTSGAKRGRPRNVSFDGKLKPYFSLNIPGMILLTDNYVHKATRLLQMNGDQCKGTTTFYFYEDFSKDADYKILPKLSHYVDKNKDLKWLLNYVEQS